MGAIWSNEVSTYSVQSRQAGGEVVYRIDLAAPATLDAFVVDRGNVDVDVHILQGSDCVASGDQQVSANVAGAVYVVVDSADAATAGEFLLVRFRTKIKYLSCLDKRRPFSPLAAIPGRE